MAQLQQTAITGTLTTTDNLTVTGSITNTGNITTGGDITVNGGYIYSDAAEFILKPSSGHTQITGTVGITQTLSASGNITTGGDLAVNGSAVIDTSVDGALAALRVTQRGTGPSLLVEDQANPDSSRFVVDNAGNVSIGTNTVATKLNISGDITLFTGNQIYASTGSATRPAYSFLAGESNNGFFRPSTDTIAISTDGVERVRVTSTGNVGIGTSSPNSKLDINGDTIVTGTLSVKATDKQATINLIANIQNYGAEIVITSPNTSSATPLNTTIHGELVSQLVKEGINTTLKIISTGAEDVGPSISLDSITGQLFRLQSSDSALGFFNDLNENILDILYNGNILVKNGAGINFSNTSQATGMTSELFNDYEEGTWTPSFSGATVAGDFSYGARTGTYTKIGNIVYIGGYVDINTISVSATGNMRITGLPFSVANTPNGNQFFMSVAWENITTAATNVFAAAADNGDWIDLYIQTSTTSTNALAIALSPTNLGTGGIRFTGFYRVA